MAVLDVAELGRLIDRLAPVLELYARQWCDSPEDVVQEAFVKLSSQRRAPDSADAWLFRTVRNGAINARVARLRRKRHEARAAENAPWFSGPGTHDSDTHSVIDPKRAQDVLEELPLEQREVIVARIWGELTFDQIAELAGISTTSAHRAYHAGLTLLRERLRVSCDTNKTRPTPS